MGFESDNMEPSELVEMMGSGDSDQVNSAIESVEDMDPDDVAALFENCFEAYKKVYKEGNGYQRQSAVRFLDAIQSKLLSKKIQAEISAEEVLQGHEASSGGEYWNLLEDFALTAIQDDDGRVRRSTIRLIKSLCLEQELVNETDAMETLHSSLKKLVDKCSGKKQKHLQEALNTVKFHLEGYNISGILKDLDSLD